MKKLIVLVSMVAFSFSFSSCLPMGSEDVREHNCTDKIDNDGDGRTDCLDSDCAEDPACEVPELCGNAEIDFGEQCDGTNLNGATCVTRGFDRGTLACSVSCQFNTSGCINDPEEDCGNGAIDAGEQCDGANLNGQTCVTRGFDRGTLACSSSCTFNTTGCSNDPTVEICDNGIDDNGNGAVDCMDDACWGTANCRPVVCGDHICDQGETGVCPEDCGSVVLCGNGSINAGEQCDGSNLNGQTCISRGYDGGTLACSSSCTFNVSGCYDNPIVTCGNGVLNAGEQCDGSSLNGQTCVSRGYDGGTLSCNSNCTFNESSCWDNVVLCGNGVINAGEQCDGSNLNGATCVSRGFTGGSLSCTSSCQFNTSSCYTSPTQVCGNGVKEGTESCDGTDFGGRTCATEGYNSGTLSCSSCVLVISGCYNSTGGETVCGDKLDNDGDGLVDFLDPTACPNNTGLARERNCTDGQDNDSDGRVDCFDHDCSGADVCRRSQAAGDNYFVCMPNAGTTDYGCVCSDDLSFWARTTVSGQLTTTTGKVCMGNAKISGDSDYEVGWTRTATCDPTEILRHMDEDGYRDFGVLQLLMVAKESGALGNMALYVGCSIDPGTGEQTQANIMVVWDRFDSNLQAIRNQLFPNGKWLQVYVGSAAYTQLDWYIDYFRPW